MWQAVKWGRQVEKDERFWVAATLMQLFHAPNRVALLASLLRSCLGDTPPDSLPSWEAALGHQQFLYFEASLPSPPEYSDQLGRHLDEHILIPDLREAADHNLQSGKKLEGATKADALLIAPDTGFTVLFEAKVVSDISAGVQSDGLRTQITRYIDVMLDPNPSCSHRSPGAAPSGLLRAHHPRDLPPEAREQTVRLAAARLPARPSSPATPSTAQNASRPGVGASALGWLTWEDCNRLQPGACPWLQRVARTQRRQTVAGESDGPHDGGAPGQPTLPISSRADTH